MRVPGKFSLLNFLSIKVSSHRHPIHHASFTSQLIADAICIVQSTNFSSSSRRDAKTWRNSWKGVRGKWCTRQKSLRKSDCVGTSLEVDDDTKKMLWRKMLEGQQFAWIFINIRFASTFYIKNKRLNLLWLDVQPATSISFHRLT